MKLFSYQARSIFGRQHGCLGLISVVCGTGVVETGVEKSSNMARIGAKLCQNAFRTIPNISFFDAEKKIPAKILDRKIRFSTIWCGFGRATAERTSKSASSSNFALERLIERLVRPKSLRFGF